MKDAFETVRGDRRGIRERAPDAEQDAGEGKDGDRQEERLSDLLGISECPGLCGIMVPDMKIERQEMTKMKLRYTQPFKEIYNHIAPGYLIFRAVDLVLDKAQNEQEMLYDTENEISVTKDIQYTENKAWQNYCGLDLYRKASETPQPVLFYTHGGGFDAGRKYHRRGMSTWMAKTGICVVNVDFGLSPRFTFKETLHMIVEAANWVVDHADEYNFDLSKVMVGGDSSGGWCALYMLDLATNPTLHEELGIPALRLKPNAAYLNCGMYDLRKMLHTLPVAPVSGVLTYDTMGYGKRTFEKSPDKELISPINYVNKDFPRTLFLSYSKWDALCYGQTQNLMKLLDGFGIPYEEYHSTNPLQNHCFMFNWAEGQCMENNMRVWNFIKKYVDS